MTDILAPSTHISSNMSQSQEDNFSIFVNEDAAILMDEDDTNTLSAENIESTSQETKKKAPVRRKPALSKKKPPTGKENTKKNTTARKKPVTKKSKVDETTADHTEDIVEPAEESKKPAPKKAPQKKKPAPAKKPAPTKKSPAKKPPAKKKLEPEADKQPEESDATPAEEKTVTKPKTPAKKPLTKKPVSKKPAVRKTAAVKNTPGATKPGAKKTATPVKKRVSKSPVKKSTTSAKKKTSLGKRKKSEVDGEELVDDLDELDEDVIVREPRKKKQKIAAKPRPAICGSALQIEDKALLHELVAPKNLGKYDLLGSVSESVSHLVVGDKKRTLKVLMAISKGIWIIKSQWLLDSVVAEKYLPEEKYEADDWFPGCKFARLENKAGRSLFAGKRFYLYMRTEIPRDDLAVIITNAGGLIRKSKDAEVCVSDEGIATDLPDGVPCVSSTWVLDCLEQGKVLETDEYVLEELDDDDDASSVQGIPEKVDDKEAPKTKSEKESSKPKTSKDKTTKVDLKAGESDGGTDAVEDETNAPDEEMDELNGADNSKADEEMSEAEENNEENDDGENNDEENDDEGSESC